VENNRLRYIYWTHLNRGNWNLHLAATSKGLCYVGSGDSSWEGLQRWAEMRLPHSQLKRDDNRMNRYKEQFIQYLERERSDFTFPLDLHGTPFQLTVWKALQELSYASTYAYSDIAELIRRPGAARAVGAAIGANPVLIAIPCHRVIGKNRMLTGYRGGLKMKTDLLQLEKSRS